MTYPLSIFVLYSTGRRRQFEQFTRLLSRCEYYTECQKILIADTKSDISPSDYLTKIIQRSGKYFCWSDAWSAAMNLVESDKVLYLDCDRILPEWYLKTVIDTLNDYEFVHPSHLWNFKCDLPDEVFLDHNLLFNKYPGTWSTERLTAEYIKLPCRGPLSGTTAFTAKTYHYVGPLDKTYQAWGYPDLEYQEAAKAKGCVFRPINTEVYHLYHGYEINSDLFYKVNLWNGVRFFKKWKLPYTAHFKHGLQSSNITAEQLLGMTLDELLPEHI